MTVLKESALRYFLGKFVLIPYGNYADKLHCVITINETSAFIWKNIHRSEEDLLSLILDKYDVCEETARRDLNVFLNALREYQIIS